jgi:hypothetical protein
MPSKIDVSKMLEKTCDRKWVLPNFQREFVWTADQIAELFDSMARGYPIGAIILLKYREKYPFLARGLDGEEGTGRSKYEFYIIDGQQRLTSLYKIIKQFPNQFITEDTLETHYFPIRRTHQDQGIEQNFAFFFKYDVNPLDQPYVYAKRQLKEIHSEEWMKEHGYIPLEYVFCQGNILNSYLKKRKIESHKIKITNFKSKILKYELTIKQCEANWRMDEYRTVFNRLNNAGTKLSAFDECASILSKYQFNLHKKWRDVSATPEIKTLDIDPMYILKTMYILGEIEKNPSNIRPASFMNLKKFFRNIDRSDIIPAWNNSVKYVKYACKRFITNYGVQHKRLIPYTPMVVTLASAWYSFEKYPKHARETEQFDRKIDWWYWSSVFSSQYNKGTDNKVALHVKTLVKWIRPIKNENVKWGRGQTPDLKDIQAALKRLHINTDARYKGILCLPLVVSRTDILGNSIEHFEDHHYFTKKDLKVLDLDEHQINNIANRMAIDEKSNKTIGNISPHKYKENGISIQKKHLTAYMISPPDDKMVITKKKYVSFLRQRTNLIIGKIRMVTKKP